MGRKELFEFSQFCLNRFEGVMVLGKEKRGREERRTIRNFSSSQELRNGQKSRHVNTRRCTFIEVQVLLSDCFSLIF